MLFLLATVRLKANVEKIFYCLTWVKDIGNVVMTRYADLTKAQRLALTNHLALERLPEINAACRPVCVNETFYSRYGKRILDIVFSAVALAITLPFNLVAAFLTKLDVGSPILFSQERAGRNGKPFVIVKFRNMTNETDEHGELLPGSQRVTKFGRFMRRTSLDELLNFWNVLKGDMSIIGPRPLPPEYLHRYSDRHRMRLAVRPGLECPPRSREHAVRSWNDQFENDVWYVEHVSFCTDLKMLVNIVCFAFDPKATGARASNARGTFVGYDLDGSAISGRDLDQALIDEFASLKGDM